MNEENKNNDKNEFNENAKVEKKEIDLLDFIALFWKERKNIIYITSSFLFIGILFAFLSTPWYAAKVKIMPYGKSGNSLLNQYANIAAMAGINLGSDSDDKYSLYPEIINSNFILERVLKNHFKTRTFNRPVTLFEYWDTEIDSSKKNWEHKLHEEAKKILRENYINAHIDLKTNLLTLEVMVPGDPLLAAELANFIINQLDVYNKYFRNYKTTDQKNFIEKSINDTKFDLSKAEKALIKFQKKNKDISSADKMLEYERLKTELDVHRTIYIELRKQLEIAKIEEVKETETLDILEKAVEPIRKFKPKRLIILITITFLGFFFSIIYIFVKHLWKNSRIDLFTKISQY